MAEGADSATGTFGPLRAVTRRRRQSAPRRARRLPTAGGIAQEVKQIFPDPATTYRRGHQQVAHVGLSERDDG